MHGVDGPDDLVTRMMSTRRSRGAWRQRCGHLRRGEVRANRVHPHAIAAPRRGPRLCLGTGSVWGEDARVVAVLWPPRWRYAACSSISTAC